MRSRRFLKFGSLQEELVSMFMFQEEAVERTAVNQTQWVRERYATEGQGHLPNAWC